MFFHALCGQILLLQPATKIPLASASSGLFESAEKRTPIVWVLTVVTLALYNPVNSDPFVNHDDDRYVTENPHIRQGLTGETFRWALTLPERANWDPLTWM